MECFAEPHVIGKHGANIIARHPIQPVHARALILAQLRVDGLRDVHALRCDRIHAAKQRGMPRAAGKFDRLLGHRLERQLPQLRHRDLVLALLIELRAATLDLRHELLPARLT